MAQSQKTHHPLQSLAIPKAITPIIEAFTIDSEEVAKTLLKEAAAAIYYERENMFSLDDNARPVSKNEMDGVYALMRAINPKDFIEVLHGAQIIVGHLLGMRKLAQSCRDDQNLGLKLLRLSSEALERLERKRSGHQNINVTYHNTSMQAIMTQEKKE